MKKSIICLAGAIGLMFTACEDTSDLGSMQVNEKPALVESNGVASQFLLGGNIDLANYENLNLPVLHTEMKNDFPASATNGGVFEVSATPDFDALNTVEIPMNYGEVVVEDNLRKANVEIEGNAWEDAFVTFFGKAPYAKTMYVRYKLYIQDGNQTMILPYQGSDWWPTYTISVTPVDLKYDVRPSYSIFGTFLPDQGEVMLHGDKHEYDDPNFTAIVSVTEQQAAAGYTLQIAPTDDPTKLFGVKAGNEEAVSGRLEEGGVPLRLAEGPWKIEVNMITKVYTITTAIDILYVPSFGNNNSFTRNCGTLTTDNFINYSGAAYISKGFGLAGQPRMRGVLYVAGSGEGQIVSTTEGRLTEDNMIKMSNEGLYWLDVNLLDMSYSAYYIKTLSIIGSMNGWTDIDLTPSKAQNSKYTTWTGEVTFTEADQEYKFRANGDWDGWNLGGSADDLVFKGANIPAPGVGTYKVTVNLLTHPYSVKFEPK